YGEVIESTETVTIPDTLADNFRGIGTIYSSDGGATNLVDSDIRVYVINGDFIAMSPTEAAVTDSSTMKMWKPLKNVSVIVRDGVVVVENPDSVRQIAGGSIDV